MKNEYEMDRLMQKSLMPDQEPDMEPNKHIIRHWKEEPMTKHTRRKLPTAAVVAFCVLAASAVVGAGAKYLTANQVAKEFAQPEIQKAFGGRNALEVNETKEAGEYRFTFLGVASGKAITEMELAKELPKNGQTYAVLAIERKDGAPMPKTSDDAYGDLAFCVSPLIEGLDPVEYNIFYTGGGYSDVWKNGILYRIVDCDELEKFADKKVYLSITDSRTFDSSAFTFDKTTGSITENKDYEGINLLFEIPYDKSKADPQAAEKYLKALEEEKEDEGAESELQDIPSVKEIQERAELVEDSVQEVKEKDKNGGYLYRYEKSGLICGVDPKEDFPDGAGWSENIVYSESDSEISYVLFHMDEDGKITGCIYREEK